MNNLTAKKWLKQALHDLDMAEKNIAIEGYDIAAFLSHQAVEKLLKALFILRGKKPPRSHYVDELAQELNASEEILSYINEISADYTISRYPDVSESIPYELYDRLIAHQKVESAQKVFNLLREFYQNLLEDDNNE